MNVQRSWKEYGQNARIRAKMRSAGAEKRVRSRGAMWQDKPERERLALTHESSGYYVERRHIGARGEVLIHPQAEGVESGDAIRQQYAGSAFTWWANQSPAERQTTINRIMAETDKVNGRKPKKRGRARA